MITLAKATRRPIWLQDSRLRQTTCRRKPPPGTELKVKRAVGRKNYRVTPAKLLNQQKMGIRGWWESKGGYGPT